MSDERPTAVAGLFYPDDPVILRRALARYLDTEGGMEPAPAPSGFKALIVPHAGYDYSGPVAGKVYRQLRQRADSISRVVLLGPSHRVPLRGMAIPSSTCFATPLGPVRLDQSALATVAGLPGVVVDDRAHAMEHSLEVQLPFLKAVLGDFELVPIVIGLCEGESVASLLEALWGGDETLIVVSSDLSHYHDWEEARNWDDRTARHVLKLEPVLDGEDACGCYAINGLLLACRRHGLNGSLIALANSGDTAGGRDRVVGYGAFGFN